MFTKRVFICWIASTIVMIALYYIWHGLVTHDFEVYGNPTIRNFLLLLAAYLVVGLIMSKAIDLKILDRDFKHKPIGKGITIGIVSGFAFFIILTIKHSTSGISLPFSHHMLNLAWQLFEQTVGGIVVGFCYIVFYDAEVIED